MCQHHGTFAINNTVKIGIAFDINTHFSFYLLAFLLKKAVKIETVNEHTAETNAKSHVKSNINKKKGYSQNSFSIWKKSKPKVTEEKGDGDKNVASLSLSSDMKSNAMRNSYTHRLDHLVCIFYPIISIMFLIHFHKN